MDSLFFIIPAILSLLLTPFVRNYALAHKIVSIPGGRNINIKPIARFGGLAVFLSFWITVVGIILFNPETLQFVGQKVGGIDRNLIGVIIGALILLGTGIADDIKGLRPEVKLLFQFLAAIAVVSFGIQIYWIHNPITGIDIVLGNWTYVIVPIWIVLLINVVNWMDGIDGLASGIGLIASVILFLLSRTNEVNQPATALLALSLAGSLAGFLPYNFNPAKIFLGDIGSMFIGFMLAIFAIISGGKFATAALVLGFPILDALWVVIRRLIQGQAPWQADRKHLHHRFLDAGFTQRQSVLILYAISAIFGLLALGSGTREKLLISFWLLGLLVIIGATLFFLQLKRRSHV